MQPDAMMEMLKSLKLHGMAQALGELAAQDSPAYKSASLVLAGLLKAEMAAREVRSLAYQMKVARFPPRGAVHRDGVIKRHAQSAQTRHAKGAHFEIGVVGINFHLYRML